MSARAAGHAAAIVPLTAVIFGVAVIELIPRSIVGGVLVFVGLGFIVDWAWDKRRLLPRGEYVVVLAIFVTIVARASCPGLRSASSSRSCCSRSSTAGRAGQ